MPPIPADIPSMRWIDPTGEVWPLTSTDLGWFTPQPGPTGLGAAPVSLVTTRRARGGVDVHHQQPGERTINWPLFVEGANHTEFIDRWWRLATAFTRTVRKGPGRLQVARPDGATREVLAHYQSGYEGQPGQGIRYDTAVITLLCEDPYWRDPTPTPIVRAQTPPPKPFLRPFPQVSSSQALGATTVVNPSASVEAWPLWSLTGPAASLTAVNLRRGEEWTIDITTFRGSPLDGDETVVIDTETGAVNGPDGSSWAGAIDWTTAVLWCLDEGPSAVSFNVAGAGSGTRVEASFYARHETA